MLAILISTMSLGLRNYEGNQENSWLHTNGKLILDEQGRVIVLRGVNFHGNEVGSFEGHQETDYARIRSWGFNVVRLPIGWSFIEPKPNSYNRTYFEKYIDRDVAWARRFGIWLILDMHQWQWSPYFKFAGAGSNGVPIWAVNRYDDSPLGREQAVADFWLNRGPNGTTITPQSISMQDRFVNMWEYVVSRYKNEPTIIGYDLLNEPPDTFSGRLNTSYVRESLFSLYERLISKIRISDTKHIIIYEGLGGGAWWSKLVSKPNLVYSTHYYDLDHIYNGQKDELEIDFLGRRWNAPKDHPLKNWNIPIIIGEFGYNDDWPNSELWIKHTLNIFSKYGLECHMWWTYYKSDTWGKALLFSNQTERMQVRYLDRPYPISATFASLRISFSFEERCFLLVAPEGVNTVQIYIPKRYFEAFVVVDNSTLANRDWNSDTRILIIRFSSKHPVRIEIKSA